MRLHLTDAHSILQISVDVKDIPDAIAVQRKYGANGWTSAPVPDGGYMFPYAMATSFDFALIGAREFTMTDKETGEVIACLNHRGQVYKRRDVPANVKKKMPARIWYSRGAKPSDNIPKDESGFAYVALISFIGNGPKIAAFEKPIRQQPQDDPVAGEEAMKANKPIPKFDRALVVKQICQSFGYTGAMTKAQMQPICDDMTAVMGRTVTNFGPDDHKGGMSDASLERYIRARPNRAA